MISFGRSRDCSASATGSATCSSVNFEYVVDSIRKIRMTSSTSMNGIRLISGSSLRSPRKFIAMANGLPSAPGRHAQQVMQHALVALFQVVEVIVAAAAKVAMAHKRWD